MFGFGRKKAEKVDGPAPQKAISGAPGKRLYAIGDVHGCAAQFTDLLDQIRADHAARPAKPVFVVSLGDLIDRGPDSRAVIDAFRSFELEDGQTHLILGNHEEMLIKGVRDDPSGLPHWLRYGGYEFCESYGIPPEKLMGLDPASIASRILAAVPKADLDYLAGGVDCIRFGDYLLVHAGIDPEVGLDDQEPNKLRWIREPFLLSEADHGVVVVHGHTISEGVDERPNRIGLDTGAYKGGKLTAVRLEDGDRSYLTA